MSIAQKCIDYRAEHRLTQQELADKVGLSREVIWRLEKGRDILPVNKRIIERFIDGK